jgi:hypothetical protein
MPGDLKSQLIRARPSGWSLCSVGERPASREIIATANGSLLAEVPALLVYYLLFSTALMSDVVVGTRNQDMVPCSTARTCADLGNLLMRPKLVTYGLP